MSVMTSVLYNLEYFNNNYFNLSGQKMDQMEDSLLEGGFTSHQ